MAEIGKYNELKVSRFSPHGAYLFSDKGEILLPNKYVPTDTKEGDILKVFVYTDSEDRIIATTLEPLAIVGDIAALKVKSITDFGVFLEWGLEKDLFVPKKELHKTPTEGELIVVKLFLDHKTQRVIGVNKLGAFLNRDVAVLKEGQEVDLLVYEITSIGYMTLINDEFAGMLYKNEVMEVLKVGDRRKGYIKKVREDDKVDLTLYKQGVAALDDFKGLLLQNLKESGGFLPLNDASSPEEIKETLKMSKKSFKKAVGMLLKEGKLDIQEEGIRLK